MRVGFVLFEYFPYGGLQRDCLKSAEACANRLVDITIFVRSWEGPRPSDPITVVEFGRKGFTNIRRNLNFLKDFERNQSRKDVDILVGFNKLPGLDLYFGSDPCFVARARTSKPFWYQCLPRYRHYRMLEESVFRRGEKTRILLLTDREKLRYQEFYDTEPERFEMLPPGITRRPNREAERSQMRSSYRAAAGWEADCRLLLFVGSGFRIKGLDRAVRAMASLPVSVREQTRLVVIGEDHAAKYRNLTRWLGLTDRVHFLGGRIDVFNWMLAADLLIHPAHSEAAGMVLLEALTAGLPVLTTDSCGYSFHIGNAGAGRVMRCPFSQAECNETLYEMLFSMQMPQWRANGLVYAAQEDLYSCHDRVAEIISASLSVRCR